MALNKDEIKKKLEALKSQASKKSESGDNGKLWKPKAGKQVIRIVPYSHKKDFPFIELYFYYGMAGKNYLSPKSNGNPDPIVEFSEKLKSTRDKENYLMAKKLDPKLRTYVPVIVRGEEHLGVRFWGFGKTVYESLLSIMNDPDYGDITDLKNGRDITVEMTDKDPKDEKSYPKTTILPKPNSTPATDSKEILEKIAKQPAISEIFKEPSYDELKAALEKWMNPEKQDKTETQTANKDSIKSETKKVEAIEDIDAAFDELLNN